MRFCALIVILTSLQALATQDSEAKKETLDKNALDVLKRAATLFKDSKAFHCEAEIESIVTDGDKKEQIQVRTAIDYQKPNLFALHARNVNKRDAGIDVIADGRNYWAHLQKLNQYIEKDCPTEPAELARELTRLNIANTGLVAPNILSQDPYEALMDGVTACAYAGKEELGGVAVHHLKFFQAGLDWELWVAAQGKPLVLKAATTTSSDERKVVTTETYKTWKFDEAHGKDTFTFVAPPSAKKVDDFGS